jgi:hypothetical protein
MPTLLRPSEAPAAPRAYALSRDRGPLDRVVSPAPTPRRRGRPPLLSPEQVLDQIRAVANSDAMFRVHLDNPALYARARRLWGSWAGALLAAGLDYERIIAKARRRAIAARRRTPGEGATHA